MKRIIVLIIALVLTVCFAACGKAENGTEAAKTPEETESATVTEAPEETVEPTATPEPTPEPTPAPKLINVVSEKPVTADYSEGADVGNTEYLVDGDEGTRWSGFDLQRPGWAKNLRHEITIDLQGLYMLKDFYISWETITGYYVIEVTADGENWTGVYTYDDYFTTATPLVDEDTFPEGTAAKMIRIVVDFPEGEKYSGYPYCSIYEFEVRGFESAELPQDQE